MANPSALVTLTPISSTNGAPTGSGITFGLLGDADYTPASGGQGGWQIIDRPRQVAATQWYDRSPMSLKMDLMISSEIIYGIGGQSIELICLIVDGWQDKLPGTNQPPIFAVAGPIPGIQHQWCLYTPDFTDAIRDSQAGFRIQQKVTITLYEYNSPLQTQTNNPSPAAQATYIQNQQNSGAGGYMLYTVVAGDTLETIAANLLSNFAEWTEIAALNNLRDPNNLYPGQVLAIPNS